MPIDRIDSAPNRWSPNRNQNRVVAPATTSNSSSISSYYRGPVSLSRVATHVLSNRRRSGSAESDLKDMYAQQLDDFNRYQRPVIDMLEDEANSTEIYERAVDQADKLEGRVASISERQLGTDSNALLPSQKKYFNSNLKRKTSLASGAMVTGGREAQRTKRVAARQALMSIAESLQTTGIANTADAASKFEARKQAAKSANKGLFGTVLGIAGTVIGGIYGGPAGASAGGSIGSAIGQGIGG